MEPTSEISKGHTEEKANIDSTSSHTQLFDYTCQSNEPGVFGVPEITIYLKSNTGSFYLLKSFIIMIFL